MEHGGLRCPRDHHPRRIDQDGETEVVPHGKGGTRQGCADVSARRKNSPVAAQALRQFSTDRLWIVLQRNSSPLPVIAEAVWHQGRRKRRNPCPLFVPAYLRHR